MEFTIPVVRIGYASKDIKVTADSLEEAQEKALEEAGNIHSDAQIFAESELPYVVCPEFKRILVAERQHKPGLEEVLKFLEENYA